VILYGSRAKGNYKDGSDIDITLLGKQLTLKTVYALEEALDELYLPYTFDISIFTQIDNDDLIKHILRVGKTFYFKENGKLKTESGAKNNSQLPKGWEVKKLGEVCEVQRGLTYSGKDAVDYSDIIVLRATNINLERSALDFSELKYLRNNFIIKDKYKLRKGSLLICFSSGSKNHLGKVALVDNNYNYAFGGFIGQINPKREVDSKYLFYSLISEQYKQYISELTDGVNINNLKIKDLQNFQIPTPSLPEQKRIITILDRTFKAIDL
jgi:restriction endonuclease S subunit